MNLELAKEILEKIRIFQRKNRAVFSVSEGKVTLAGSHLLTEIISNPGVSAKELGQKTLLPKQAVSRLLASFNDQSIVIQKETRGDRRSKQVLLTKKGESLVKAVDKSAEVALSELLNPLKKSEIEELAQLFNKLADGFNVPPIVPRSIEPAIRAPIRRVTRALGLMGNRVLGAEFSVLEWHLISEIAESYEPQTNASLSQKLEVSPALVNQTLESLVSKKHYLQKFPDARDRRRSLYALTIQGGEVLNNFRDIAATKLKESCNKYLNAKDVFRLTELLDRVTRTELKPGLVARFVNEDRDLGLLRRLALDYYCSSEHEEPPGTLFFEKSINVGARIDGVWCLGIEFFRSDTSNKPFEIRNLVWDLRKVSPELTNRFKELACAILMSKYPKAKLL